MRQVSGRRDDLTIDTSQEIERDINALRDQLKTQSILEAGNHEYSYAIGSIYSDIIAECEKLGDYVMNVVETRLGRLLLSNRWQVLSRQQLMDNIWSDVIVSDHTVNVHITRLRKKLGPYASHIVSRQGFGYVFETG